MAARIITLAKDLTTKLEAQLGKEVRRRYLPYLTSQNVQLEEERITVYMVSDSETVTTRSHDDDRFELGIQVAQTLPESGEQSPGNPDAEFNQLDFLDARMQTVDSIKDLFRDEGELRSVRIGGCYFNGLSHERLFNSDELMHRLFSSIVVVSFMFNGE
ncbi:hypothetical protein [Rhodopirellula halodulae]|uniref:hypothetical protein n=1 Tax=Rhodopirellula halodulae TaxID=2894198 RepID=UPI001E2ED6A2|nr:hypothetical protein [Rhodopirellula sp. JC737]MCC9655288.1 hypothetical protein [Rhodopirellula sp. JC737]